MNYDELMAWGEQQGLSPKETADRLIALGLVQKGVYVVSYSWSELSPSGRTKPVFGFAVMEDGQVVFRDRDKNVCANWMARYFPKKEDDES
jgi:hypothetical protein